MPKPKAGKTTFACSECGAHHARWSGQCAECGAWNTIAEVAAEADGTGRGGRKSWTGTEERKSRMLSEVQAGAARSRILTGIGEFDRVLGGGVVVGSVVLIGGDPGIGKSTLLLQAADAVGRLDQKSVLYVTGEESLEQVAARCLRLGLDPGNVRALAETHVEQIQSEAARYKPDLLIADSIQTLYSETIQSAPGTVSQVRECAALLTRQSKQTGMATILVGHVTKDGSIAGPRVLEHMVDAVLAFEGDPSSPYRLIRAPKNRFGAANEIGAFEMTEGGLVSVDNPSALFLSEGRTPSRGSCVCVLQEGPRAMLVEVQALLDDCQASNPKRLAVGVDANRLSMLLAVLHRHMSVPTAQYDAFVNAVGGIRATEPAADLSIVLSVLSSLRDVALPADMCCFGEIGLTGEVRPVQMSENRLREAAKLGFTKILMPQRNLPDKIPSGVEVVGVSNLGEAIAQTGEWS